LTSPDDTVGMKEPDMYPGIIRTICWSVVTVARFYEIRTTSGCYDTTSTTAKSTGRRGWKTRRPHNNWLPKLGI